MRPLRPFLIAMVFSLVTLSASSQTAGVPQEPELLLPGVVLEIEEIGSSSFEPILPPPSDLALSLPPPDLPLAEALSIPDAVLNPGGAAVPPVAPAKGSSLYTQGTLGAGSLNRIVGSVALYKTGGDLRFRGLFSHEGMDGYAFHEPGTGFFRREDRISGNAEIRREAGDFDLEAGFVETEEGLQGLSPVYSATHRFIDAGLGFTLRPAEGIALRLGARGDFAGRLLSSPDPGSLPFSRENGEYSAQGEVKGSYSRDRYGVSFSGKYGIRSLGDYDGLVFQRFSAGLGGEFLPADLWRLGGDFGVSWNDVQDFTLPFSLSLSGSPFPGFSFLLRGGLKAEERDYRDLWKRLGLLRIQETLRDGRTWYGEVSLGAKFLDEKLSFRGGLEVLRREYALVLEDFDPGFSDFPFRQENMLSFLLSAEFRYAPFPGFVFKGGNKSLLGKRAFLESPHRAEASLELIPGQGRFNFALSGEWKSDGGTFLPDIGFQGGIKPADGIEIVLSVEDLFSPLAGDDRRTTEPFIASGFRVMIKTVISF